MVRFTGCPGATMAHSGGVCLFCCESKGRPGGCIYCGPQAAGREPPTAPISLRPRTWVKKGQYLIGRVLGTGGFGITYIAIDKITEARVAVKELFPRTMVLRASDGRTAVCADVGGDDDFDGMKRSFLAEARALAHFRDHPNIASVLDFFEDNGTAYIVQSYLDGATAGEVFEHQRGPLRPSLAVGIIKQALNGLKAVHQTGMLHRDIKPHNIFITRHGVVKLIDFGAARFYLGSGNTKFTEIFSQHYAPPEQCLSNTSQGPWTDTYAVGATLYRLVSGNLPPVAQTRLSNPMLPQLPSAIQKTTPGLLWDVMVKALELNPDDRFRSVEDFEAALVEGCRSYAGPEALAQAYMTNDFLAQVHLKASAKIKARDVNGDHPYSSSSEYAVKALDEPLTLPGLPAAADIGDIQQGDIYGFLPSEAIRPPKTTGPLESIWKQEPAHPAPPSRPPRVKTPVDPISIPRTNPNIRVEGVPLTITSEIRRKKDLGEKQQSDWRGFWLVLGTGLLLASGLVLGRLLKLF